MNTKDEKDHIQASVLDRLIDYEPQMSREPTRGRMLSFIQIKAMVIRDLENLLNTKSQILPVPAGCKQVNDSLFVYGLPDFTSQNPKSPSVRNQLRHDIEMTISKFEPRLKNVAVHVDASLHDERNIRLRISGLLVVDPVAEPVSFDTYFDINKGEYKIPR